MMTALRYGRMRIRFVSPNNLVEKMRAAFNGGGDGASVVWYEFVRSIRWIQKDTGNLSDKQTPIEKKEVHITRSSSFSNFRGLSIKNLGPIIKIKASMAPKEFCATRKVMLAWHA
eukprot:scaffold2235_cov167-Amphora_coffeaeformis.AAC.1